MRYTWIPMYKELAHWILSFRDKQGELCEILRKVGFSGNLEDMKNGEKVPLMSMDPFTFFAFFMKIKNLNNRTEYFRRLKKVTGLKSEAPGDFYGVPSAQPMSLWYFGFYDHRSPEIITSLWDLAEQAIAAELKEETFKNVYRKKGIQLAKLSQGLFWLNPEQFYPIDAHKNYLEQHGINIEVNTLADYLNILDKIKSTFKKSFYEISSEAWKNNNEPSQFQEPDDQYINSDTKYMPGEISLFNLNTILFGPPGTGKTYNSIDKAVQIANPSFYNRNRTRDEIRKEYLRLKTEGQIEFITFHQSMSYEDFIEGIKPKKPEEGETYLKYEIKEGLFKKMVIRANYKPTPQASIFSLSDKEFDSASFYKLSLGNTAIEDDEQIYRYCIDNNCIALGWGGANDFTGKTEHEIQLMVPAELEVYEARAVNYFIHYLKKGDYVVVSYGNLRFRAVGKVVGDYEYRGVEGLEIREVKQFRNVQWLLKDVDIPVERLYNKQFSQQTIYKLNKSEIKRAFFVKSQLNKQNADQKKNFVLVIDEINRGNVAQIFGELITLIEPDKRKGAEEELEVMLPYSKDLFSVPSNLYILGTMNTADRSVEALDTALRRRFVFEEMRPKSELLSPKQMICTFWNKPEHIELHDEWEQEPYFSKTNAFYDLIGFTREQEEMILQQESDSDRLHWVPEDFNILSDNEFTGLNLDIMLVKINERLSGLLTKDHTIGHAWFMDIFSLIDLQNAFKNKILPLLQEYFYNNYAKIGLVLGKAFIEQKSAIGIFAKDYNDAEDLKSDYEDKIIYSLKDPFQLELSDFKAIYI